MGFTAIVPAAGSGTRMGAPSGKLLLPLCGQPLVSFTLLSLASSQSVDKIVIVTREEDILPLFDLAKNLELDIPVTVVRGGATRAESVLAGLTEAADAEWVMVHDGARCLITPEEIDRVAQATQKHGAAAIGVRVKDTIKVCDESGKILTTPDRRNLWAVQTPQAFSAPLLKNAFAELTDFSVTDDCAVCERAGIPVYMVEGSYENIKITTPDDLLVAEGILKKRGF